MAKTALLIVDVQNDFCPGGALPVPDGDRVIEPLNCVVARAIHEKWFICASRDWHPRNSRHFVEFGGQWPAHCIQNTEGARFYPELYLPEELRIFSKGCAVSGLSREVDGYSAFDGRDQFSMTLRQTLPFRGVELLYVAGLATDYCVKATVLDACLIGYKTRVLINCCRGVERNEGDSRRAVMEMMRAGAEISFEPYDSMVMRIPRVQQRPQPSSRCATIR
ncbi:MAG: nicotinamidase [Candidatus Sungbacteria bacterium]|nr:nicotinamidase [Candidatus Sungbacteria bacterium]